MLVTLQQFQIETEPQQLPNMCREEKESARMRERRHKRFHPPPLGSPPLVYPWFSWQTWDWVSQQGGGVTVSLSISQCSVGTWRDCMPPHSEFVWMLRQPWRAPALRLFAIRGRVVAGDWALMFTVTVHQSKAAGENNLSSTPWFMDVIPLVRHQLQGHPWEVGIIDFGEGSDRWKC